MATPVELFLSIHFFSSNSCFTCFVHLLYHFETSLSDPLNSSSNVSFPSDIRCFANSTTISSCSRSDESGSFSRAGISTLNLASSDESHPSLSDFSSVIVNHPLRAKLKRVETRWLDVVCCAVISLPITAGGC